ncbi:hypothetical protein [Fructobacillus cardui]|uniref:hypothetical protein n=1 Tax=Fructobacillus cardui TaxID=2893170 RepID=UPI002D85E864|nr:hypothetical protein R53653_IHELHDKM_01465 [Fructobacillus cardui]
MIYNKKNLRKVEDKKVLRKVKSQWVVVSLASFGLIAGIGVVQHVSVSADSVQQTTSDNQSGSQTPSGDSASASSSASASASASASLSTSVSASASTSTSAANAANNSSTSSTTPTVPDTPANYQAQISQGEQDAYAGNASAASSLSGRAADYYTAAYNGAKAAMAAYAAATQSKGAGTQDYTYYGNTASKLNSDGTTHTTTNPTDGTPQQYGSADDANQGGANTPAEAYKSSTNYENQLNNKLNVATNTSVKGDTTKQISIPTSQTQSILDARAAYQQDANLGTSFDNAVAYALSKYGQQDAETGKWQGTYVDSKGATGNTKDWYLTTNPNSDTTNPYDQAYRGAVAAMAAYFNNNAYRGNTSVTASSTGNTYYDQGFNDVVSQAAQGIAYVQNGNQFASVLTGSTYTGGGGTAATNINTIRLANDVDLTGATNGEDDVTAYVKSNTFTIDGQNHIMDYHGLNYTVNNPSGSLNLYIQNFQTLYGANYFGPFRAESGAGIYFSNLNYVGPQLLSSNSNDAYFSGNVNVIIPNNSTATYNSPFQSAVPLEGGGNQQNLEVKNFVLQAGSHYYGTSSPKVGGVNIVAGGNFTVAQGAKMTLVSRGTGAESSTNSGDYAINLTGSNASLNINKDATVNIIPDFYSGSTTTLGGGVYASGASITINGGTLNYEGNNGSMGSGGSTNKPIYLSGGSTKINVINGGMLQVLMDNVPGNSSSNAGLIANTGNGSFNVGSNGSLKVGVTNSPSSSIIPYYGPININSVSQNHVVFIKPDGTQYFQTAGNGNITAYSVAVTHNGQKTYLYQFQLPSGSSTYTGTDMNGQSVTGTVAGNTLDIANVPAVQLIGPLVKTPNQDGSTTVTGYVKLTNYSDLSQKDTPLYIGVASGTGTSYDTLTQIGSPVKDTTSTADPNTYTETQSTKDYNGGLLAVSYTIPKGTDATNVGMRFHYGVNSVNSVLTPTNYTTTMEAYKPDGKGGVVADPTGSIVTDSGAAGATSPSAKAITDAKTDAQNNNTAQKDSEDFNTKNDQGYTNNYNSYKSGYSDFAKAPANQDVTQTAAYQNADSPSAYLQGYNDAATQAGIKDAQSGKDSGSTNTQYQQARTDYNNAKKAINFTPGQSAPAAPKGSSQATAQAYTDAQGAAAFFKDEEAGTIQGTSYAALTPAQQTTYNQAYAGYIQAGKVSPTATNPDTNATTIEQQGFDYGQSLINGGLSKTAPTAISSNIKYLSAAILGYNTAQAAITQAQTNGTSSAEAKATDPTKLSTDGQKASTDGQAGTDLTFYRSVKFGNYAAQNKQSDSTLDQYAEVGYYPLVSAQAYKDGAAAYQSGAGSTPTATADTSSKAAQNAFTKGYNDAQTGTADGIKRFLNGTAAATSSDPDDAATSSSNTAQTNAQKGFDDDNKTPAVTDPTLANDKGYQAGQNAAKAAQQAAADEQSGTDHRSSVTDTASYDTAKQEYEAGAKAAAGGNTTRSTDANPVKQQAYNKALDDAAASQAQAIQDAKDNDGKAPAPARTYSVNPDVQTLVTKAYSDAQTGYTNALNGKTPGTSATDAEKQGATTGTVDKAYVDAVVAGGSPTAPSDAKKNTVDSGIAAAKAAVAASASAGKDPQSVSQTPADSSVANDPLATYAYQQAVDQAQKDYQKGVDEAKNGKTPDNSASDAEKQGATDFTKGFNGGNGSTAANSNSGEQAGNKAADSLTKGYEDAEKNTDDSSSDDPVQKLANAAAKKAFADSPNFADTSTMDPISKAAYEKAEDALKNAAANGAQEYLAGKTRPDTTTVTGAKEATGYDAAKSGFADGANAAAGSTADSTKSSDSNYMTGYNAAQAAKKAEADTANNTDNPAGSPDAASYTKAQTAYAAGITDAKAGQTAQSTDSDPVKQQAYNQALADYQKGVDEATNGKTPADTASAAEKQGASDFNKGLTDAVNNPSSTPANAGEQAGKTAAATLNNAVNDAKSGTSDDSQDADPVKKASYIAAAQAYKDEAAGTPKSDDAINALDPVSKFAYQTALAEAKAQAQNGQDAFTNGTGRPTGDTPADKVAQAAYDKAQKGYEDAKNNTPTAADADNPAYKAGQAAYAAGKQGATTSIEPTTEGPAKQGYDGNKQGAADALAGKDEEAALASKPQAYQDAYNNAYNAAKQGLTDGGNAAAGTAADTTKASDPNYKKGYDAAQAGKQGAADAANNVDNSTKSTDPDSYKKAQGAYQDGEQAAADAAKTNTKPAETTNTDPVYKQAYDQALTDAANKADYQKGVDEATNGKTPADTASAAEKQGATDFNAGFNGGNGATIANPTAGQKAGMDAANGFNKGYEDAQKGTDDSQATDPVQKAANVAAAQAYEDVAAGTPKSTDAINALNPISKAAYQRALTDAQNSAANGEKAYLSGQTRPDDSTPAGKAAAAAYDRAKQGYADAAAGKTTDADQNDPAYLAGKKAYTDGQTGYNGTTTPAADASQQTKDAYSGATSGATDAVAGKAKPTDLAAKSPAYQVAYNKAYTQAQAGMADATASTTPTDAQKADPNYMTGYNAAKNAADSGSQAFLNGQARPDDSTPAGKAAATAYDAAKNGYNGAAADAQSGNEPTDAEKADPAYMKGYQAYKDSQTGYTGAGTDTKPAADAPQAAQDAYNGGVAGAKDGAAGAPKESDLSTKSQVYQDAYNKAYADAAAGAKAGYQDGSQSGTPTDLTNKSAIYKQAYAAAKAKADAEATAGAADFAQGKSAPTTATAASQYGYDRAKAGFDDANAGKPAQANDAAYMAGYNSGLKRYTTTNNTAQDDALFGKGRQDANLDDADKTAYDQAYARTIAGLNDGANGAAKAYPDDANYLKGYAAGQAVKALLADKQNNTKTAVDDQASYGLANQGYLQAQDDVKNGRAKAPNNQNPVYVLAYDLAYDQLLKEKEAQGTVTSAEPTATDNVTPTTKSSVLPATGEEKTAANNSGLILGLAASFLGLFAAAKRNKRDEK